MSNQIKECTIKSRTSLKYKMATLIYSEVWNFCVERENSMYQHSVLELGHNQPTSKQAQA